MFARTAALLTAGLLALPATASDDPIATRKALMQSKAAAGATSVAMLRGESDYDPAVAKAAITALHASALAAPDYFLEGTDLDPRTTAAPAIWDDPDGFAARVEEFRTATTAAVAASGDDGPADLAAFQSAIQPVLGVCRDCHETYRIQD